MPLADNFADNLQAAIERKGISQRELSRLTGVHFTTINLILKRKMDPSLSICEKLAEGVGLRAERIFREPIKAC